MRYLHVCKHVTTNRAIQYKVNIKKVDDFKYLGSYIGSTEHDINIRISKAWANNLNNRNIIWKSNLIENLKINFFRAAVETVLVYGSEPGH